MAGLRLPRFTSSQKLGRQSGPSRGVVFPSPVVMLSIIAVAMAAIAFFATRGGDPTEQEIATPSRADTSVTATPSAPPTTKKPDKPKPPKIVRNDVYVEVYNNSGITGLAGSVSGTASDAGWQVVGTDNWYGSIPTTTVYYPQRLERAAKLLALDLGISRTALSVGAMKLDRLTVILTGQI